MNIDEAIEKALKIPDLAHALSFLADWECDRAIHQAIEFKKTGINTSSHPDGGWDTCFLMLFERFFDKVHEPLRGIWYE